MAPSFGDNMKQKLLDLAVFTGARFISSDAGHKLDDIKIEDLGRAAYVTATKTESIVVGGKGDKTQLKNHIEGVRKALARETQEFEKRKLEERIAKLTSGIAVIKVGGLTEVEMLERIERVKDSVAATKSAMLSGIVPGGEVVYLQVREKMPKPQTETDKLIHDLLYKVLYEPFKKLVSNAGLNDGQIYEKLITNTGKNMGIDVKDGKIKDMVMAGIIDPALVATSALRNATSVAIAIFTTGALIIPDLEAERELSLLQNSHRNV
jgi:chaperonin GroEL